MVCPVCLFRHLMVLFLSINTGMKITEIKNINEVNVPSNDWENLKMVLDRIFTKGRASGSEVKRVNQGFDAKTGEQVVVLQYRYRMPNQGPIAQKPRKAKLVPDDGNDKKK